MGKKEFREAVEAATLGRVLRTLQRKDFIGTGMLKYLPKQTGLKLKLPVCFMINRRLK